MKNHPITTTQQSLIKFDISNAHPDDQTMIIEEIDPSDELATGPIAKYSRGKMLGKGGFAKCYEVVNLETRQFFAAKIIPKANLNKTRSKQKLLSEIRIHKSLLQKHIVQFEHVFEDNENVYILLELCPHQTLNELLKRRKRLTEIEVQTYLVQIIQAVKFMHGERVIHREFSYCKIVLNLGICF